MLCTLSIGITFKNNIKPNLFFFYLKRILIHTSHLVHRMNKYLDNAFGRINY